MTLVAGIDSSTQSCKVVIRDADTGVTVRTGRGRHPEGTEVHPDAWWTALQDALAEAGGLDDVAAISVGGQQHGMVVLDAAGEVIRPAQLWNDTKSAGSAQDLIAEVGAAEFVARTGSVPVASFTGTKLRWLRDNEPENAARVAAVALPHDWLTWRLRGFGPGSARGPVLEELRTDASDASGTSYFNPSTGEYDRELLALMLGHDAILPAIIAAGEHCGDTDRVVAGGAGDNAAAALGLGAVPGDIIVSIGTSGTVSGISPTPSTDTTGTVAGFADASGNYLPLVATLNAARILDTTAALLGVDFDGLAELALATEPGAKGLVLQPYFEGERTPNLPDATATLYGMTLGSTTRGGLARAAIEGLLCGLADGLDAVRAQGLTAERILLIGGAAQNRAVQAIAAQVFDVPVVVPEPGEYVASGAAVQAAWALTGTRPSWSTDIAASPAVDHRPVIREQYAARAL